MMRRPQQTKRQYLRVGIRYPQILVFSHSAEQYVQTPLTTRFALIDHLVGFLSRCLLSDQPTSFFR
jgi:hypothetical protein